MASKQDDIFGFYATRMTVPPGATLAVKVQGMAFESNSIVKYLEGGSLEIVGISGGFAMTYAGASLVALAGTGYLLGGSEALSVGGPANYYLMATGATTIACILKGMTAGY